MELIPGITQVRWLVGNGGDGLVYTYLPGSPAEAQKILSTIDYANDTEWSAGVSDPGFDPDFTDDRFDSDFENFDLTSNVSESGGGWLRKKTITTEITTTVGEKDFYTHTLKADYDIDIQFIQGPTVPEIDIFSVGDIILNGNVNAATDSENNVVADGTVTIESSQGSITQAGTVFISAVETSITSFGTQSVQIQGGIGTGGPCTPTIVDTEVMGVGDIIVNVVSDGEESSISVVRAIAHAGNVILASADGIHAFDASSIIRGNRVELFTKRSGIGDIDLVEPLRIDSSYIDPAVLSGLTSAERKEFDDNIGPGGVSVTVTIEGDIFLLETSGDMVLVEAVSLPGIELFSGVQFDAAIGTVDGDVELVTTDGDILDGIEDLFKPGEDSLTPTQVQLIADGIATADDFLFPLSPGLLSVLFPHSGFLGTSPSTSPAEMPNIIGNNVILTAGGSGQIGDISDQLAVDLTGSFGSLTNDVKQTLSDAAPSDVIGVTYQLYKFVSSVANAGDDLDLKLEDFSDTTRWEAITAITTGVDDQVPIVKDVAVGAHVLVQFDQERYGLYRRKAGGVLSIDLADQDYANTALWEKIRIGIDTEASQVVHATDDGTPVLLMQDQTRVEHGGIVYKYIGTSITSLVLKDVNYSTDADWEVEIEDVFLQDPARNTFFSTFGEPVEIVEDETLVAHEDPMTHEITIYSYRGATTSGVDLAGIDYAATPAITFPLTPDDWVAVATVFEQNPAQDKYLSTFHTPVQIVQDVTLVVEGTTIYRYVGATTPNVDLTLIDFTADVGWIAESVDVEIYEPDPAMHKYRSSFQAEDIDADDLVFNKFEAVDVTLQLFADVDIEDPTGNLVPVVVVSGGDVSLSTPGNMEIESIVAMGDVRLVASGNIVDLDDDALGEPFTDAVITTTGNLTLVSETGFIGGADGNSPLRFDVSSSSELSAFALGDIFLEQVVTDLIVSRIDSLSGFVDIVTLNGDMFVGEVTAGTTIYLETKDGIFDIFSDTDAPVMNITNVGEVKLNAKGGDIGDATNFLDIKITGGELFAEATGDIFLHSVENLNIKNVISTTGNVTLDVDGNALVDLIQALVGTVTIDASLSITDRRNDVLRNIYALKAVLVAVNGIGSESNPFDSEIHHLAADTGGEIWLDNTGDLIVDEIGPVVIDGVGINVIGITAATKVDVSAASNITINAAVFSTDGPISFDATDSIFVDASITIDTATHTTSVDILLDAGDNIEVNAAILSGGGVVSLQADDDITFTALGSIDTETGGPTVILTADAINDNSGNITMADGSFVDATDGLIDVDAYGDITLSLLRTTTDVAVDTTTGWIRDTADSDGQDIIADRKQDQAHSR